MTTIYQSLQDKHILITGGGSGIGAALVQAFHSQGARVSFFDIDDAASQALCQDLGQGRVRYYHVDLRDIPQLQAHIKLAESQEGGVHCLLNNAARDTRYKLQDITPEIWDDMQQVNIRHCLFATQAVQAGMKALGGGSVINFTSSSYVKRSPNLAAYGSAKAGIVGMTRILSRELGVDNIRVNVIMPGWVMTERQQKLWLTPEAKQDIMAAQSLKNFLMPEDVANLALFLASDDSRMISAQTYVIDGGWV